jgi:hypothetical protein
MLRTLNDSTFIRKPEMIRALVPACVSLQIPVKMGMKLVAQTAALFWSVDHVFCNFEVGMDSLESLEIDLPVAIIFGVFPSCISPPLSLYIPSLPHNPSVLLSTFPEFISSSPRPVLISVLFLSQWLRSIERDGTLGLTTDEAKIVSLLRDLLFEADPDADAREPMSALLLTVWADQFDGVNVWGSRSP